MNAALLRHADGASAEAVLAYLERVGRFSPTIAAKRFEFNEHPLWRTYVFVYHEGEALLRQWLEAVPVPERPARVRAAAPRAAEPGRDRRRDRRYWAALSEPVIGDPSRLIA